MMLQTLCNSVSLDSRNRYLTRSLATFAQANAMQQATTNPINRVWNRSEMKK